MSSVIDQDLVKKFQNLLVDPKNERIICCIHVKNISGKKSVFLFSSFQCLNIHEAIISKKIEIQNKESIFDISKLSLSNKNLKIEFRDGNSGFQYEIPNAPEVSYAIASYIYSISVNDKMPIIDIGTESYKDTLKDPITLFQMQLLKHNLRDTINPEIYFLILDYFSSKKSTFSFPHFRQIPPEIYSFFLDCILINPNTNCISTENIIHKEISLLCNILSRPSSIKLLEICGPNSSINLKLIISSIKSNQQCQISELSFKSFSFEHRPETEISNLFTLIENSNIHITFLSLNSSLNSFILPTFIQQVKTLQNFSKIERFAIFDTQLDKNDLYSILIFLPILKDLTLDNCGLDINDILEVIQAANLCYLIRLDISRNLSMLPFNPAMIPRSLTSFQAIDVSWNNDNLFSTFATVLNIFPEKGQANFSNAKIPSGQWSIFESRLNEISTSYISDLTWQENKLSVPFFQLLSRMPNLKTLDISGSIYPGHPGTDAFLQWLPTSNLITLYIKAKPSSFLSLNLIKMICIELKKLKTVKNLDLSGHNTGPEILPILGELLKENTSISYINFIDNSIFEIPNYFTFFEQLQDIPNKISLVFPDDEIEALRKSDHISYTKIEELKLAFSGKLKAQQIENQGQSQINSNFESDMRAIKEWKDFGGYTLPFENGEENYKDLNLLEDLPRLDSNEIAKIFIKEFSLPQLFDKMNQTH